MPQKPQPAPPVPRPKNLPTPPPAPNGRLPVPSRSTQLTRVVTVRMPASLHFALIEERKRTCQSINTIILLALSFLQEKNQ